jgi:hypothetical protein
MKQSGVSYLELFNSLLRYTPQKLLGSRAVEHS